MKRFLLIIVLVMIVLAHAAMGEKVVSYIGDAEKGTAFGFILPEGWVGVSNKEEGSETQFYYSSIIGEIDEGYLVVSLRELNTGLEDTSEKAKALFTKVLTDLNVIENIEYERDFWKNGNLYGVFYQKEWQYEEEIFNRNGMLIMHDDSVLAMNFFSRTLSLEEHSELFNEIINTLSSPDQMQNYVKEMQKKE